MCKDAQSVNGRDPKQCAINSQTQMSCTFDAMITPISITNNRLQTRNRNTVCSDRRGQQTGEKTAHCCTGKRWLPDCSGTESSPDIRGCSRSVPDKAGCKRPAASMSLCASTHLLLAFLASSCQSTCSIAPKHSTAAHHPTFSHWCKQQILRLQQTTACSNQVAHHLVCCEASTIYMRKWGQARAERISQSAE